MKSPRIFLAFTAAALVLAACDLTPTGGEDAPIPTARFDTGPDTPPAPPADSTGDGGGVKGSGG